MRDGDVEMLSPTTSGDEAVAEKASTTTHHEWTEAGFLEPLERHVTDPLRACIHQFSDHAKDHSGVYGCRSSVRSTSPPGSVLPPGRRPGRNCRQWLSCS